MPSTRLHNWTEFEEHALFCIIARNIHKTGLPKEADPTETPATLARRRAAARMAETGSMPSIRQAHIDVADLLNKAIHGVGNYGKDIDKAEVSRMIDHLMVEKKGAIAYLERQRVARVTRAMKKVWRRGLDFDGSLKEWDEGRKENDVQARTETNSYGFQRAKAGFDADREEVDYGAGMFRPFPIRSYAGVLKGKLTTKTYSQTNISATRQGRVLKYQTPF